MGEQPPVHPKIEILFNQIGVLMDTMLVTAGSGPNLAVCKVEVSIRTSDPLVTDYKIEINISPTKKLATTMSRWKLETYTPLNVFLFKGESLMQVKISELKQVMTIENRLPVRH
jgi:hypothetical protein